MSDANPNEAPVVPVAVDVLHVADADAFARFGRMFRQLGLALSNAGADISLLTDDPDAAADLDGTPVVDCLYPSFRGLAAWRLESFLGRTFSRLPAVVHLWGTTCLSVLSRWTASLGIRLIIHVTTEDETSHIERRGVRAHERVLTACASFADTLNARWASLAESFTEVPPAILAPKGGGNSVPIAGHTLGIVWAGRFERDAGLDLLLDAARRLRTGGLDFQIALIGDGPASDQIWRVAAANNVSACISMTNGVKIWDRAIGGADVLVVPARQRRLSLAPLLAMASGTLVVASDDQAADWFIDGETALLFPAGDSGQLAASIQKVACGNPSVSGIPRAARTYVRAHHAITDTAERLAAMYRDLAGQRVS
jgi:glycosyltransferase involved in cell wall biosynthesis